MRKTYKKKVYEPTLYNIKLIKSDFKMQNILNRLGIKLTRRGSNNFLLCPFHNDKTLGSCYINKKTDKVVCESCGKTGDIHDVVCQVLNLTPNEGWNWITEGDSRYLLDETKKAEYREQKAAFNINDFEILGIVNKSVTGIKNSFNYERDYDANLEMYYEPDGEKYLKSTTRISDNPLYDLYKDDKKGFMFLLYKMIEQKKKSIKKTLDYCKNHSRKNTDVLKIMIKEYENELLELDKLKVKIAQIVQN